MRLKVLLENLKVEMILNLKEFIKMSNVFVNKFNIESIIKLRKLQNKLLKV